MSSMDYESLMELAKKLAKEEAERLYSPEQQKEREEVQKKLTYKYFFQFTFRGLKVKDEV